jgi:hypothetical protein
MACDDWAVCAAALTWLMQRLAAVVSTTDGDSRIIRFRILMHAQPDTRIPGDRKTLLPAGAAIR